MKSLMLGIVISKLDYACIQVTLQWNDVKNQPIEENMRSTPIKREATMGTKVWNYEK